MPPARPRRRAVGPPGAHPVNYEPRVDDVDAERAGEVPADDDERLRAERPPHHDRER